jgi:hypothetical protein
MDLNRLSLYFRALSPDYLEDPRGYQGEKVEKI